MDYPLIINETLGVVWSMLPADLIIGMLQR